MKTIISNKKLYKIDLCLALEHLSLKFDNNRFTQNTFDDFFLSFSKIFEAEKLQGISFSFAQNKITCITKLLDYIGALKKIKNFDLDLRGNLLNSSENTDLLYRLAHKRRKEGLNTETDFSEQNPFNRIKLNLEGTGLESSSLCSMKSAIESEKNNTAVLQIKELSIIISNKWNEDPDQTYFRFFSLFTDIHNIWLSFPVLKNSKELKDEHLAGLCKTLKSFNRIKSLALDFSSHLIQGMSIDRGFELLPTVDALVLKLPCNDLYDYSLKYLSQHILRTSPQIKQLSVDFEKNLISEEGLLNFCETTLEMKYLTHLNINHDLTFDDPALLNRFRKFFMVALLKLSFLTEFAVRRPRKHLNEISDLIREVIVRRQYLIFAQTSIRKNFDGKFHQRVTHEVLAKLN